MKALIGLRDAEVEHCAGGDGMCGGWGSDWNTDCDCEGKRGYDGVANPG